MEIIKNLLKKHPISIIFYLLYVWIVISEYRAGQEIKWEIDHGQTTHMRCGIPLSLLIAPVFIIVTMANILAKRYEMKFYTCLLILIIAPIIILGNMH